MATYKKARHFKSDLQIASMKAHYPQFTVVKKNKNEIEFIGTLQPKPEYPVYKVSILYRGSKDPRVKVISPNLVNNPPHFYKRSGALCLYHPDNLKWSKNRTIAKFIVPLTSAWIYFYEVWLETDKWYGPEAGHGNSKNPKDE